MKKMLRLDEIEAQMALELPERDLMTKAGGPLEGLAAVTGNLGALTSNDSILNNLLCLNLPVNDHMSIHTSGDILDTSGKGVTC
ncbi:MAG: hypothetical protein JO123_05750 [Ktedonobacteraceae bacterium]|nr:hypothetical protein [Ktedonobacteraceae bacterium]